MIPLSDRIRYATDYLEATLRLEAPKDTGALSRIGINRTEIDAGHVVITIGSEEIFYAAATNEPWPPSKTGKHRRNPNEGWIQRAIERALPSMKNVLIGGVTEADLVKLGEMQDAYQDQLNALALAQTADKVA